MQSNPFVDKKILVVDDFGDMRMMLINIMRMLGANDIDSNNDGLGAIASMKESKYDIILCDYNLGSGKDGQQVLEEARFRGLINMSTIFIMVTAESTRSMVMGALEYEPDAYISKPFSKDLIKVRLERVLARKQDLKEIYAAVERKQLDKAVALLDEKLAKKPKNASELMRVKADLCLQSGDYDCSQRIYEQVLAAREVPWAQLGLGKTMFSRKKYQEAIEIFQGMSNANPELTVAMDWLARCYQATGENDKAKEALQAALDISPRAIQRQKVMGNLSLQTGDYEKAEQAFSEAVTLGKNSVHNHPNIYSNLARSQVNQDKHDEAMASVQKIKKAFYGAQNADIFMAAGEAMVYHKKGETEKAAQAMSRVDALYDESGDHSDNDLLLELAKVASDLGDKDKAESLLKIVIQNNHDDENFLKSVTAIMHEVGLSDNPEDYVSNLRKEVVEMNNRGVRLLQKGDLTDAVELFDQAARQMQANKIINTNAARAMLMLMEKHGPGEDGMRKVRGYLDRIRKIDAGDEVLRTLSARLQKVAAVQS